MDKRLDNIDVGLRLILEEIRELRREGIEDRKQAAEDRRQAIEDRRRFAEEAAKDRAQAARDRRAFGVVVKAVLDVGRRIVRTQKEQTQLLRRILAATIARNNGHNGPNGG